MLGRRADGKRNESVRFASSPAPGARINMTKRFNARHAVSLACCFRRQADSPKSKPAAPAPAAEPLAPVAWMVGGTWVSDVKDPSDGTVDSRREPYSLGAEPSGHRVQYRLQRQAALQRFLCLQSRRQDHLFYYTNSEGEMTIGTATPDPDGKTLHQEFDIMHPDGKTGHIRSTCRARRKRRLLVHRLHAEGWRVGTGIQDSLRAEVSQARGS